MSASGGRGRGAVLAVVLVVGVLAVALLGGDGVGRPYDLDDAGPNGFKGLRLVLEAVGGRVERIDASRIGPDLAGDDVVVLVPAAGRVPSERAEEWEEFARSGGQIVIGSPGDGWGPQVRDDLFDYPVVAAPPGTCDVPGLEDVEDIDTGGLWRLEVPDDDATSCFGDGGDALVVHRRVGEGSIVTLAGPALLTNDALRPKNQEVDDVRGPMRDNSVLAVRLLLPEGTGRVAVVTSGLAIVDDSDTVPLSELLGSGVKLGLWQLVAAAVLFAWWRSRRHGGVVVESQPVSIAGSELVAAVGNLMSRRADPAHAAAVLRASATRDLAERLGVPRGTEPAVVASLVATRTGRDAAEVMAALGGTPVTDDADLLAVAARLEAIRTEVLHG